MISNQSVCSSKMPVCKLDLFASLFRSSVVLFLAFHWSLFDKISLWLEAFIIELLSLLFPLHIGAISINNKVYQIGLLSVLEVICQFVTTSKSKTKGLRVMKVAVFCGRSGCCGGWNERVISSLVGTFGQWGILSFTLLYTTLHYFTLLYNTLHYFTLLYTTLHYFTVLYTT